MTAEVLSVVAGLFALLVVRWMTERQHERAERLAAQEARAAAAPAGV